MLLPEQKKRAVKTDRADKEPRQKLKYPVRRAKRGKSNSHVKNSCSDSAKNTAPETLGLIGLSDTPESGIW